MKKKAMYGLCTICVAIMMILPVSAVMDAKNDDTDTPFSPERAAKVTKAKFTPTTESMAYTGGKSLMKPRAMPTNTQVTSNPEDEFSPTIAVDSDGTLLSAYTLQEDFFSSYIPWIYSTDEGNTWEGGAYYEIEGGESHPAADYRGAGKKFCGTFYDPVNADGSAEYIFLCDDITDPETYSLPFIEWNSNYPYRDRLIPSIAGYDGLDVEWWWGIIAVVGTRDERVNMPIFNYDNYEEDGSQWSSYDDNWQGCEHANIDIDTSNGNIYAVFDYFNETKGDWDIVLFPGNCHDTSDNPGHPEWFDAQLFGESEATIYPDVGASGNNVMVVAQSDEQIPGKWDIVCYYSVDGGENWGQSFAVADSADDELYPSIVCYGMYATCIYTVGTDVYYTHTTDGGATWDAPEKINDQDGSYAGEYRSADIATGGNIVWADTRNGNTDVYYDNVGAPGPILSVESVSGGFGAKATVTNSGTVSADNVEWSMVFDGPVFIGKEKSGTVTVPAGGEATISSGFIFGIGSASVTVTVGGASKTASGFVLGPFMLGVS